jgi:ribosomal protein L37E
MFGKIKKNIQDKSVTGMVHESVVFTAVSKLFQLFTDVENRSKRLEAENAEYRVLQENQGQFIFLDGTPDYPLPKHLIDIVFRHNKFAAEIKIKTNIDCKRCVHYTADGNSAVTECAGCEHGKTDRFVSAAPEKTSMKMPDGKRQQ